MMRMLMVVIRKKKMTNIFCREHDTTERKKRRPFFWYPVEIKTGENEKEIVIIISEWSFVGDGRECGDHVACGRLDGSRKISQRWRPVSLRERDVGVGYVLMSWV